MACPTDRSSPRSSWVMSVPSALMMRRRPPGCRCANSDTSRMAPSTSTQLCPFSTWRSGDREGEGGGEGGRAASPSYIDTGLEIR